MADPLVSFIIAAYNEQEYIAECINSCLNQTYSNIEICITDDGSTDKTFEIINSCALRNKGIKINKLSQNKGKVVAFNKSFEMSSGKYVSIIGADDIAFENRIKNSLLRIEESDMLFGNLISFHKEEVISSNVMNDYFGVQDDRYYNFKDLLLKPVVFGNTIFALRKALVPFFPLPEELSHEDWWIPLCLSYNKPIKYIDTFLVKYRLHDNQSSSNNSSLKVADYKKWIYLKTREASCYNLVKKTFTLDFEESAHVNTHLFINNIYKSAFRDRLFILIDVLKENNYRISMLKYILPVLEPRMHYIYYVIRFYIGRMKKVLSIKG